MNYLNKNVLLHFLENQEIKISDENSEMLILLAEKGKLTTGVLEYVLKREKVSELELNVIHALSRVRETADKHKDMAGVIAGLIGVYCSDVKRLKDPSHINYDVIVIVFRAIAYADHANIHLLIEDLIDVIDYHWSLSQKNPVYLKGLILGMFEIHNMFDNYHVIMSGTKFCQNFIKYLLDIILYHPAKNYSLEYREDKIFENKLSQAIKTYTRHKHELGTSNRVMVMLLIGQLCDKISEEENPKLNIFGELVLNQLVYGVFNLMPAISKAKAYYNFVQSLIPEKLKT